MKSSRFKSDQRNLNPVSPLGCQPLKRLSPPGLGRCLFVLGVYRRRVDVVQAVRDGRAQFQWSVIQLRYLGYRLELAVFRDALKVDGLRPPVNAKQMQEIADLLSCVMLTPKVVDQIWLQAKIRFDSVINHTYPGRSKPTIVADMPVADVNEEIERKLVAAGGDDGVSLIDSVGKYWVLTNGTPTGKYGKHQACNYGWCSSTGRYPGVTSGVKLWQSPGYQHNDEHFDPSQLVRLMYRFAVLWTEDGSEDVDVVELLQDPKLCHLLSHEGPLRYLRQAAVPEPPVVRLPDGTTLLPELTIYALPELSLGSFPGV